MRWKNPNCPPTSENYFPLTTHFSAKLFCAAALIAAAVFSGIGAPAAAPEPRSESFTYNIQFLLFTKAAQGRLSIRPIGGRRYRAELTAETKGLAGILMYGRENHYISEMEFDPIRRRFISRLYIKQVRKQAGVERTEAVIDTESGMVKWKYFWREKLYGKGHDPIPEGARVEDLLSGLFNFRIGGLGPVERGRNITLFTLPNYKAKATNEGEDSEEEEFQKFEIRIPTAEAERAYRKWFGRSGEKGLLVLVKVPKNLFGQETGEVRVWLDPEMVPVATTVEDAIYYGDVYGVLVKPEKRR